MKSNSKAPAAPRPVSRSGRFAAGPAASVADFSQSVSFDWRLWRHDIAGSQAHAAMLASAGLITPGEAKSIHDGLDAIAADIAAGRFDWKPELEDVHMNIEAELTRRAPAGAKLHTGRSRNDQVALDIRLWIRDEMDAVDADLERLQRALLDLAERHPELPIPGYTHLQRGQPVYFAHHLLAYAEMLDRDRGRFRDARERANVCPLGSGALAGSTLPLDRHATAKALGFVDKAGRPRITANSMDAVSDRDFAVEFCAAAALTAVHLSRLAEDFILWATAEFGFIKIADAYTTGSSLMPQKKNPDVAELTRGKSARVIGDLVALLTLLKGLPMTYNRDLQEDKERLFDAADTVRACLRLMAGMAAHTSAQPERCRAAAADPQLLATDLVDELVRRGTPFRQAHHWVGAAVARAEALGKGLDQLPAAEYRAIAGEFGDNAPALFDLDQAFARRKVPGAPGPDTRRQLARWRRRLGPGAEA